MAFPDIVAMLRGEKNSYNVNQVVGVYVSIGGNISYKSSFGMAYEPSQTKFETILRSKPYSFYSVPSFKPWSLKIPISDGYHETLCSDLFHL